VSAIQTLHNEHSIVYPNRNRCVPSRPHLARLGMDELGQTESEELDSVVNAFLHQFLFCIAGGSLRGLDDPVRYQRQIRI